MNKAVIASTLKVSYDSITINSQYNLGEGKSIIYNNLKDFDLEYF